MRVCRITGHTYLTYGPLLNGASAVVFEGVPSYPDAGRCWQIVEKYRVTLPLQPRDLFVHAGSSKAAGACSTWCAWTHRQPQQTCQPRACCCAATPLQHTSQAECRPARAQVKQYYTAPTLIRSLMSAGDHHVTKHDRSSLRILGTVGEPINPIAWEWCACAACVPCGRPSGRGEDPKTGQLRTHLTYPASSTPVCSCSMRTVNACPAITMPTADPMAGRVPLRPPANQALNPEPR